MELTMKIIMSFCDINDSFVMDVSFGNKWLRI
jgi:hypothetical protein